MGKIGIIFWREYINGVRNKAFIVMCFVFPLLIGGLFFTTQKLKQVADAPRTIVIVDASGIPDSIGYAYVLHDTMNLRVNYDYVYRPREEVKKIFQDSADVSILWIPENFMGGDTTGRYGVGMTVKLISTKNPGINTVNLIQNILSAELQRDNMRSNHLPSKAIDLSLKKVVVANEVNGTISDEGVKTIVGLLFGFVIYMYILMFGVRIMRSVVEEKTTRIVEIIISSVKPFQLMIGKIMGVTMVGITQFLIWIILSMAIIIPVVNSVNNQKLDVSKLQTHQMKTAVAMDNNENSISIDPTAKTQEMVETLMSIPWTNLIPSFLLYFLFGYLFYAAIFAAMGSAADVEADTQQFSVPVTIPLIIAMASSGVILNDPNGTVAHWMSMIPFTSPIVMMMRIPFGGVTVTELLTSLGILVASFLFMTWIAGKIYRVGILMYGKKASWKELGKWIFYKA
ncbi:ABC transporter permease [soil metagenome]